MSAPPWMPAWLEAQRELLRLATPGLTTGGSPAHAAQRRLAEYAQDFAGIAGAFWRQLQSGESSFEVLREPLMDRYQRFFAPPGLPAASADPPKSGAAWIRCQQAGERYAREATAIAIDACGRLGESLSTTGSGAPPITSLRELHALWIECGEAAYAAAAHREEFAAAQAELLMALVELRAGAQGT